MSSSALPAASEPARGSSNSALPTAASECLAAAEALQREGHVLVSHRLRLWAADLSMSELRGARCKEPELRSAVIELVSALEAAQEGSQALDHAATAQAMVGCASGLLQRAEAAAAELDSASLDLAEARQQLVDAGHAILVLEALAGLCEEQRPQCALAMMERAHSARCTLEQLVDRAEALSAAAVVARAQAWLDQEAGGDDAALERELEILERGESVAGAGV